MDSTSWFRLVSDAKGLTLYVAGQWQLSNLAEIDLAFKKADVSTSGASSKGSVLVIDGSKLESLDTAGAMLLMRFVSLSLSGIAKIELKHFRHEHEAIYRLAAEHCDCHALILTTSRPDFFEHVGRSAERVLQRALDVLAFIGETGVEVTRIFRHPSLLRLKETFVQLELVCLDAIPIVMMVNLLIGVVIAYLFAGQIEKYGANIFIVDGVSIAMCREMSPIIVAIILAGRSGSAFTAQIGTMKLNEEIDAMLTFGLSPMRVLVFPRLFALVLAMPLLVFVGDVVGIFGSMLIADFRLGITFHTYLERLHNVLKMKSVFVGLVKGPVFAAFIAIIGCQMGLSVENNARSVGLHTTSTVVQSIVSVILLNAAFAVILVELGI